MFINTSFVFGPTPQISETGSGCKKSRILFSLISNNPFGLHLLDASLAINLFGAIPTEQVIFSSLKIFALMASPISRPLPKSLRAPVTSRNASSSESGST